ncbi:MAG: hypothetical protein J6S67_22375 [Methanobrevibacter sp.]|nr:hypothetical protein [Methanobrevibacter sp.]
MSYGQQFYPGYMPNPTPYGYQPQPQYPQTTCSFINSVNELNNIRVMPNWYYLGINRDSKEIYVRKMNNDGNIEVETYTLKSESKVKSEYELLDERLTGIEQLLKEKLNVQHNEYVSKQPVSE